MALLKIKVKEEIKRSLACFSFIFERSLVVSLMNDVKFKINWYLNYCQLAKSGI